MLKTATLLLMNGMLLMLRIAPGDSFLKPLSEVKDIAVWVDSGDVEARNVGSIPTIGIELKMLV